MEPIRALTPQANAFLADFIPRFNARCGREARDPEAAWVRPESPGLDLAFYFAVRERRTVRADHTLSWSRQTLQIRRRRGERSLAGTRVMVHTTPEGDTYLYAGKQRLAYSIVAEPAPRPAAKPTMTQPASKPASKPTRAKPTDSAGTRAYLYAAT